MRFLSRALAVIGGALSIAATIPPADAISNLAAWAEVLGFDAPALFMSESADVVALIGGVALLVIAGIGWLSEHIPLNKAALILYEQTRQSLVGEAAEQVPGGPLGWYATALIDRGATRLYGKRPPSRKRERIPNEELPQLHADATEDGATLSRWGEKQPRYVDITIRRWNFLLRAREVSRWGHAR